MPTENLPQPYPTGQSNDRPRTEADPVCPSFLSFLLELKPMFFSKHKSFKDFAVLGELNFLRSLINISPTCRSCKDRGFGSGPFHDFSVLRKRKSATASVILDASGRGCLAWPAPLSTDANFGELKISVNRDSALNRSSTKNPTCVASRMNSFSDL